MTRLKVSVVHVVFAQTRSRRRKQRTCYTARGEEFNVRIDDVIGIFLQGKTAQRNFGDCEFKSMRLHLSKHEFLTRISLRDCRQHEPFFRRRIGNNYDQRNVFLMTHLKVSETHNANFSVDKIEIPKAGRNRI